MQVHAAIEYTTLTCQKRQESGGDEPYLWTFFFQLDGSTIKQTTPNAYRFTGNVKVATGSGSHRNIGREVSPGVYRIPPSVGRHECTLRSIPVEILGFKVNIPGILVSLVILMEEDAISDSAIEAGHTALQHFLESRFNEFINNITEEQVNTARLEVSELRPELSGDLLALAKEGFIQMFIKFADSIKNAASEFTRKYIIEASGIFDIIPTAIDPDDQIADVRFVFNEQQINGESGSLLLTPLISTEDGKVTASYYLIGQVTSRLQRVGNDIIHSTSRLDRVKFDSSEFIVNQPEIPCMDQGTIIKWSLYKSSFKDEIHFTYPFVNVEWAINDIRLYSTEGTIEFDTSCSFDEFDMPQNFVKTRTENRRVKIRYVIIDGGAKGKFLHLYNNPEDGNFDYIVTWKAVSKLGQDLLHGMEYISNYAYELEIDPIFLKKYFQCLLRQSGVDIYRNVRSKKFNIKDLMDPQPKFRQYEDIMKIMDQIHTGGLLSNDELFTIKQFIANKFNIKA
ncbi:hypothetical protein QNH39_10355 [Neobacillus novalis]|uniref:Uncharacterized protein n=1 Tax=Neobacillus novalis TaxID=220687 RepID=A0AA95MV11_9BACI|nr:hypothetical protein [Neobacillus novalis]WHY88208.1 hypothetical protein QNH39_10355 [Neobacillus novalis]